MTKYTTNITIYIHRDCQKKDPLRFCIITPLYNMLLHLILEGILLVLLLIQIGIL